ncbi:MAG: cyclase family protein [Clostridium sp.]|uniref:cyclase family protein n=1 Tax=Clostridium sp. TaxID=1506 RepID=UPI001ECB79A4|nr:cyclase family protein [Clostridium sp.]MBS5886051.1 cyclase family protein [Clostridium sp.]MDU7149439.1 cyclase family protein [Clostridium sp.]MDU7242543.1 cyclase family protein [Clostridium sp.]
MRVIDLSHTINKNMTTYTKDEKLEIYNIATIEKDGFNEKLLRLCTHTGTHIDAPSHMINKGKTIEEFNISEFIGIAFMIDISNIKEVTISDLTQYEEDLRNCDFLILKTGWESHWGTKSYFNDFPSLTEEAAKWICDFSLRGIGIDAISIDKFDSIDFEIHNIVLSRGKLIIENLTNLDDINSNKFTLVATPLKIEDGDASPVRAIALTN